MLYGYSKVAAKEFPCHPKDVCREWNWDTNPRFKDNPQMLADFRRMFEPQWNPTIGAIRTGRVSIDDRFAVAGYWAQLTTCTPAWHKNAVKTYEQQLIDFIPLVAERVAQERPEHRQDLEDALARGQIRPNVDADHVKAILTAHLADATFVLYEQDWTLLVNDTAVPFVTSDNPSSVFPRHSFLDPLTRLLPLAPDFAILAVINPRKKRMVESSAKIEDLRPGALRRRRVDRKAVVRLNRVTIMNADEIILASGAERQTRRLVRNHRKFQIAVDHEKFPIPGGHITGSTLVVRQQKGR